MRCAQSNNASQKEKDPHLAGLLPHKAGSSKEITNDNLVTTVKAAGANKGWRPKDSASKDPAYSASRGCYRLE